MIMICKVGLLILYSSTPDIAYDWMPLAIIMLNQEAERCRWQACAVNARRAIRSMGPAAPEEVEARGVPKAEFSCSTFVKLWLWHGLVGSCAT